MMSRVESPATALRQKKQDLIARFLKGDRSGFSGRYSQILDDYFRESFARSTVGLQMQVVKNPFAIIALGGYARKELCIRSDVDVLFLFKKRIPDDTRQLIQEVLYPLWDMGLDVGYATRPLRQCLSLASQDFEVLTSLMDSRFLCGISSLYSDLVDRIGRKVAHRHRRAYIEWIAEKSKSRHAQFGDSTDLLEPNLKEGQGGLRDFHAMLWMARANDHIREPRDLEFSGHLSHEEFHALDEALAFIRTARNWLHYLSGRRCDQLYFAYQVEVANALGFRKKKAQQGVERFLGALHGQMELVKRHHLLFLKRELHIPRGRGRKKAALRSVAPGLQVVNNTIDFESPEAILDNPFLLIAIFEKSAALGFPLAAGASRLVKEFLYLVDEAFQSAPGVVKSLDYILAVPTNTFNVLDEMLNTGLLVALIPEIKGMVNRIQYDEYHVYPVDKHCLRTVQALKELACPEPHSEDRVYEVLYQEIRRPQLLLWAALFHDVGKGIPEPRDHAREGALIVKQVFKRMGFPQEQIESLSFLVREHLLLMHTATRRDISDENTVVQCARRIPDREHLNMLYLLTVSDSKATGPKAWNDWKAFLLRELFSKVDRILLSGELATPAISRRIEAKRQAVFQAAHSMEEKDLNVLFEHFSPRYLLYTLPEDIVRHAALYYRLGQGPFVLEVQTNQGKNYRTVTICAKDFPGLFSILAGVFALNSLPILSAQVYTWGNQIALDVFQVKAPPDRLLEHGVWDRVHKDLRAVLEGELALSQALDEKAKAYSFGKRKLPDQPSRIIVDNEISSFFTIIEITTNDRLGLLYKITSTLFQCGLDIRVAKIATKGDQAVDVFYVRDLHGQKVDDPHQGAAIKEAVRQMLCKELPKEHSRPAALPVAALRVDP